MSIRFLGAILLGIVWCGSHAFAAGDNAVPKFSDYPSPTYSGTVHIPSYYVKSGDVWRDDMGKEVSPPTINFAGKYYIGLHSCGTECRYYTLSDLTTGSDSKALDMFSSDGEKIQTTSDGRTYVTELISQPNSKLLVAQYHIDQSPSKPAECRQRMFVLDDNGDKITPVTKTLVGCCKS